MARVIILGLLKICPAITEQTITYGPSIMWPHHTGFVRLCWNRNHVHRSPFDHDKTTSERESLKSFRNRLCNLKLGKLKPFINVESCVMWLTAMWSISDILFSFDKVIKSKIYFQSNLNYPMIIIIKLTKPYISCILKCLWLLITINGIMFWETENKTSFLFPIIEYFLSMGWPTGLRWLNVDVEHSGERLRTLQVRSKWCWLL